MGFKAVSASSDKRDNVKGGDVRVYRPREGFRSPAGNSPICRRVVGIQPDAKLTVAARCDPRFRRQHRRDRAQNRRSQPLRRSPTNPLDSHSTKGVWLGARF
jgi:hypothetical protein